jgi:AcrR family transcriptional regulator
MTPSKPRREDDVDQLQPRLELMIDPRHELARLAAQIDWASFDQRFGPFYAENGRVRVSTRLMVGLHLLKRLRKLSDGNVCERWIENPYFQYFCGETVFRHALPVDRAVMARWRRSVGADEILLQETGAKPPVCIAPGSAAGTKGAGTKGVLAKRPLAVEAASQSEGARRAEILEAAATLFSTSGVRTSLKDIADASGILPGSIYYHFDSKEAIVTELVNRYRNDLDHVASEALDGLREPDSRPLRERVIEFSRAISVCVGRHAAAVLMTLYEPPTGSSEAFRRLVRLTPTMIHDAMFQVLSSDRGPGAVRPRIDVAWLADRLCESMLRRALADPFLGLDALRMPELRCKMLLEGLAAEPLSTDRLDRSDALRSAREAVASWRQDADGDGDDRAAHLRAVARAEFGRRGYEATTLREIAEAAGWSAGAVYRSYRTKEELLASIMSAHSARRNTAWDAILGSTSSVVEKLDALIWLYIQLVEQFSDAIKLQVGLLRASPPSIQKVKTTARWRDLQALLAAGQRTGELRPAQAAMSMYTRSVYEALWTPDAVVRAAGAAEAHAQSREIVLQGALPRA